MIKLNTNKTKTIEFDFTIQGADTKDLDGSVRLIIDGVEYGFPINIMNDVISVDIPPLSKLIKRDFKDGESVDAKLEIITGNTYMKPWEDRLSIEIPMTVEATIKKVKDKKEDKPVIKIDDISVKEKNEDKKIEKKKSVLMTKFRKALDEK